MQHIAIVGYGKMGIEIENQLKKTLTADTQVGDRYSVVDTEKLKDSSFYYHFSSIESFAKWKQSQGNLKETVCIDFTQPDQALQNIKLYAEYQLNAVIGTTGWYDELPEVEKIVKESGIGLVYSTNYSTSVQVMMLMNKILAALTYDDGYEAGVYEEHHRAKKDAPSGTATTLADDIIEAQRQVFDYYSSLTGLAIDSEYRQIGYVYGTTSKVPNNVISIAANRVYNPGRHEITAAQPSTGDSIKLIHQAGGRTAFAKGAVDAANWVREKSGIYNYAKIIQDGFKDAVKQVIK